MLDQFEKYFDNLIIKNGFSFFNYELLLALESEFNTIPENSLGLYSWYFFPDPPIDAVIKPYNQFFRSKEYSATVKNVLKEEYFGNLKGKHLFEDNKFESYDFTNKNSSIYLKLATIFFSPPIYIGRSIDLKKRLKTHLDILRNILNTGEFENSYKIYDQSISDEEIDNENESNCFANRIGKIISEIDKDSDFFKISNFFVKVIIFKENIPDEDLNKIEYFLNRTYNPLAGLR